jgi:hypothetical protein
MKNLFTITELKRDTTEEMITFTLEIKNKPGLIQGQIKYELKKGIETELSSFSGLNDSHGYTEFTTMDIELEYDTLRFYDEELDKFVGINKIPDNSIKKLIVNEFSHIFMFDGWDAMCFAELQIFEAVDEAVENNVAELLEGES